MYELREGRCARTANSDGDTASRPRRVACRASSSLGGLGHAGGEAPAPPPAGSRRAARMDSLWPTSRWMIRRLRPLFRGRPRGALDGGSTLPDARGRAVTTSARLALLPPGGEDTCAVERGCRRLRVGAEQCPAHARARFGSRPAATMRRRAEQPRDLDAPLADAFRSRLARARGRPAQRRSPRERQPAGEPRNPERCRDSEVGAVRHLGERPLPPPHRPASAPSRASPSPPPNTHVERAVLPARARRTRSRERTGAAGCPP